MTNSPPNQQFSDAARSPQGLSQTIQDDIDLGALISTVWRGKWFIALLTVLAIIAGGYYAIFVATPLYRSTAVLILETQQKQIVDLESVVGGLSGDSSEVNSEMEVLRSRGLMGKVVDQLDLTRDPEFNSKLRPVSRVDRTKDMIRSLIGVKNVSEDLLPADEKARRERDAVVTSLLKTVSVQNVRLSLVFNVTVETQSPEKSALIADTIVKLYVLNQLEVKFEATEQATTWLTERVSGLQTQLEDAEQRVSNFSASTELISVEALQAKEVQLKDLRERIKSAEQGVADAESRLAALQKAETREDRARLANDPQLDRFLIRAKSDPKIADAFDARFDQVLARAELELNRSRQQANALRASEQELSQQYARRGEDLITLQQYTREAEAIRLLYEYFLTRLNETAAQQGIQQADSRVLSTSVVPGAPSSPKKAMILAFAGILGAMIGIVIVLLREARNSGYRTAKDLEAHTGYTVLGQIPQIPARNRKRILHYLVEKPTSAAAEAFRNLRTSVLLSNVDNPPKVILLTSSLPDEGKTTNSLALTQNLAALGKSVLLIEGDIRRRTVTQYSENMPNKGLVSLLSGDKTLEEVLFRPPNFGADIILGEKTNTNAADLFASDKFKNLIAQTREKYDAVIIDTPPVLVVPDARIIAQSADAVLFTVLWDKTSRHQVEEALRMFHNSNQRITGLVLSQISAKRMKSYGYGGRYGAYAGYGSKYYDS